MRLIQYAAAVAWLLAGTTGCLSLGTKTTHVHDNPETETRISALERRVGTLEQALSGGTVTSEAIPTH
jgi:hypothetical protein